MADRADDPSARGALEQLLLAGFGGLALTAERLESLASAIAERSGIAPGEAKQVIEDQLGRWRGDAGRFADRAAQIGRELGLASRDEVEELRLQVAQLEHRLRLLERDSD
jgi:polyhydroxyalkanoate synthesis regulator phasin